MFTANSITWKRLAQLAAISCGRTMPSDDEADYILWEHTGFPGFWKGKPIPSCIEQLQDFYTKAN